MNSKVRKKILAILIIIVIVFSINGCSSSQEVINQNPNIKLIDYDFVKYKCITKDGAWYNHMINSMIDYYYYSEIDTIDVTIEYTFVSKDKFSIATLKGKMGATNITNQSFLFQQYTQVLKPQNQYFEPGEYTIIMEAKGVHFFARYIDNSKIDRGDMKLILNLELKYYE